MQVNFMLSGRISRNIGENIFQSYTRAKYPNVGIPVFTTPLTICEVKFIFTSPINHLTLPDHDFKMIFMS